MKKVREKEEIMKENVIKFIKNNWRWMILFIHPENKKSYL